MSNHKSGKMQSLSLLFVRMQMLQFATSSRSDGFDRMTRMRTRTRPRTWTWTETRPAGRNKGVRWSCSFAVHGKLDAKLAHKTDAVGY